MQRSNIAEILNAVMRCYKKYGGMFKLRFGPSTYRIMLCDPKSIGFILSNPKYVEKTRIYETFKGWLGDGLFTTPGT